MQYFNTPIFTAHTNPGTGTVNSPAVDSRFYVNATVQAEFTDGTSAGTLKLQGSNDPANPPASANWNDIASLTAAVTSGAVTTTPTSSSPLCCQWIRVVFLPSAGAGTFNAYLHANGY